MTKLEREIDIAAPPERVYDVVADPNCLGHSHAGLLFLQPL